MLLLRQGRRSRAGFRRPASAAAHGHEDLPWPGENGCAAGHSPALESRPAGGIPPALSDNPAGPGRPGRDPPGARTGKMAPGGTPIILRGMGIMMPVIAIKGKQNEWRDILSADGGGTRMGQSVWSGRRGGPRIARMDTNESDQIAKTGTFHRR